MCQVEHAVVERVEACEGDELELEAHGSEFLLELGDGRVVQVRLPVERRRAVVGEQLVRELAANRLGELLGDLEIRHAGLHPDEVGVRGVGLRTGDAGLDAVLDAEESFCGAGSVEEFAVTLVDVGGDQRSCLGVGAGDDDRRDVGDVRCQTRRGQGTDVLLGGDQNLAAEVAALLLRGELVFPVHACGAGHDHGLLQLVGVQCATEAGFGVGHDRCDPVLDGRVALDLGDLVGAQECVVDATDYRRHRVGRVEALVRVRVAREVGVAGDLPAGEVDRLEAGANLLHGLVAGEGTERVDVVLVVDEIPQDLAAAASEGRFFDDGALEVGDLLCGEVTGDALPAGVGVPILLDLGDGLRGAGGRHLQLQSLLLLGLPRDESSHRCQALLVYSKTMAHPKTCVYQLLVPILAIFTDAVANVANFWTAQTSPIGRHGYSPVAMNPQLMNGMNKILYRTLVRFDAGV